MATELDQIADRVAVVAAEGLSNPTKSYSDVLTDIRASVIEEIQALDRSSSESLYEMSDTANFHPILHYLPGELATGME